MNSEFTVQVSESVARLVTVQPLGKRRPGIYHPKSLLVQRSETAQS